MTIYEGSGHDWWHINRVKNIATRIAKSEGASQKIVYVASLMHEFDDKKLDLKTKDYKGFLEDTLTPLGFSQNFIREVYKITKHGTYVGTGATYKEYSLEGHCLRGADLIDSAGAIGIARLFMYSGSKGIPLFVPNIKPDEEGYKNGVLSKSALNHFHEKILLLEDWVQTETAKKKSSEAGKS